MNKLETAAGLGLGAYAMYLLDVERGRRRRALARDRAVHWVNVAEDALDTAVRDLANRAGGAVAERRARWSEAPVSDYVLVERVRATLGRWTSHPGAIEVMGTGGSITLSGPVLEHEHADLLEAVRSVRGVQDVEDHLELHPLAGSVPGLQGGRSRPGERSGLRQENWAPATRLLAGAAGTGLTLWGFSRGGLIGWTLGTFGIGTLARGLSNVPLHRMVGGGGRRAVDFQKTITVPAPVDEVFAFWSNLENLPRFMAHLREVRRTGEGRSHWVAVGPGGTEVSWDAEITQLVPNELLSWRSVPGSVIGNAGIVRFERTLEDATRLTIRMTYNPPAGAVGHVVAMLFGVDPKRAMDEDLVRLQSLFVDGKTRSEGREVRLKDLERGTAGETAEARQSDSSSGGDSQ